MTCHLMYNADRCSKEFIDGVHYFLRVDSYIAHVPYVRIGRNILALEIFTHIC